MSKKLCLNIGAGENTFKHYPTDEYDCENIDQRNLPGIDYICTVGKLSCYKRFKRNQYDYILASHIIEHFNMDKTEYVLREWFRVLKSGGTIEFRMPNLKQIMREYLEHGHAHLASKLLYGDQDYSGNFHYVAFDESCFLRILRDLDVELEVLQIEKEGTNMVIFVRKL